MVVEQQIANELKQIAVGMAAPAPRESLEQLIAHKRQKQGIPCKENAERRLGTLAEPMYIALPK